MEGISGAARSSRDLGVGILKRRRRDQKDPGPQPRRGSMGTVMVRFAAPARNHDGAYGKRTCQRECQQSRGDFMESGMKQWNLLTHPGRPNKPDCRFLRLRANRSQEPSLHRRNARAFLPGFRGPSAKRDPP